MARLTPDDKLSFTRQQAAEATGYAWATISAAIRSGDLRESFPEINGKKVAIGVILRDDLLAWLRGDDS